MGTAQGIIDEVRHALKKGAELGAIDSTDQELVLTFRADGGIDRFQLDAEAVKSLMEAGLLDQLTEARPTRKKAIA